MPVYLLNATPSFPPVEFAEPDGVLAVGGDLSMERLLVAYSEGIFPWYSEGEPILWWSPNPRMILFPDGLKISKSMRSVLRNKGFKVTFDTAFAQVISNCGKMMRPGQSGTWITEEMKAAYEMLHGQGFAHSVEVWLDDELVGGLYGVSLGKCFFGESMFSKVSNASKVGFITLVKTLEQLGYGLIDCQVYTQHLDSLGAEEIARSEFIQLLADGLEGETLRGKWTHLRDEISFEIS